MLKARGVSERRGCSLCEIGRSSFRYLAVERDESELISRLLKIARRRKRFGYRRAHALLVREGLVVNHKRIERLWRILGLTLPKRRPRKKRKARGGRAVKGCASESCLDLRFRFRYDARWSQAEVPDAGWMNSPAKVWPSRSVALSAHVALSWY